MSAKTAAQHTTSELQWIGKDKELVFCSAASASQPGRVNTVALDTTTGATHCDCKATENHLMCWHRDLIAQRYVEEVVRQYVARLVTLAEIEAVGKAARARIDACGLLWALVSPLDRAMYQAARVAWHQRAASAAPTLALAA